MARKLLWVDVTQYDIDHGVRKSSTFCMVSVAIARAIPDATRIEVDTRTIRFTSGDGERLAYLTPAAVEQYVVDFDAGDSIKPFRFQLRDPMRVRRRVRTEEGRAAERLYNAARNELPQGGRKDLTASPSAVRRHSDRGGRKAPPRVFRTKSRTYGMRQLRINRERSASE